jgi:P63C domain
VFAQNDILNSCPMRATLISEKIMKKEEASEHAKALSSLGASKGGRARAENLTAEERREIASRAAKARWGEQMPRATHGDPEHPLTIGDIQIPCYVLDDGRRVLVQAGMFTGLDMKQGTAGRGPGDRLAKFISTNALNPYVPKRLRDMIISPVNFKTPSGSVAYGYEATVLADLCDVVLEARQNGKLNYQQEHIAARCEILVRGFARVGIIALVDEATGFQYDRSRKALEQILEAFIKDELGKWAKRFPDEFYRELFRLKELQWPSEKNPPQYVGHWTNDLIYKRLAPGVLDELRGKTPKTPRGNRKNKFYQWLTDDVGHPKLQEHISAVIALMKSCDDWDDFHKRLNRALPVFKPMPLLDWADKKNAVIEHEAHEE